MITYRADTVSFQSKCIDLYNKITSNSTFIQLKETLLNKFLFLVVAAVIYNMNLVSYNNDRYLTEAFVSIILSFLMSLTVSKIMYKLLPSLKTRAVYCLMMMAISSRYSLDIFGEAALGALSVAVLFLMNKKLYLLSLPLIFAAVSLNNLTAFLLIPYIIFLFFKKEKKYPALNISFTNGYLIIAFVIIIVAFAGNVFIHGTSEFNFHFLKNALFFLIHIHRIRIVVYFFLTIYIHHLHRRNKLSQEMRKVLILILAYNVTSILLKNDILQFPAALIICSYIINNFSSLWRYMIHIKPTNKQKYLQIFALVIFFQRAAINSFNYTHSIKSFLLTSYYISYFQFGFIQRGVLGTIFELFLGSDMKKEKVIPFSIFLWFLTIIIILVSTHSMVRKHYRRTYGKIITYLSCIMLMLPYILYTVDVLIFLLGFVCIYLAIKNKSTILLIPIICFLAMMTHQVFASLVFPLVFSVLVYRIFINSEKHTVRNSIVLFITFLVVCTSLVYFTYYNPQSIPFTSDEVISNIAERSGGFFEIDTDFIRYVYLDKNHEHFKIYANQIFFKQYVNTLYYMVLMSPLAFIYWYAYKNSIKKETSIIKKIAYVICMISFGAILPLFIRDTDFGRWCSSIMVIFTAMPAFLLLMQPADKQWDSDYLQKPDYVIPVLLILVLLNMPTEIHWGLYRFSLETW